MTILGISLLVAAAASPETLVVPQPPVLVTGTRTSETVLQAPAAITVVDRRSFQDTRGISLLDALHGVPGAFVQSRGGAQDVRITIRGFGARGNGERSNTGNIRGIRILTDGIPVSEPDGRSSLDLIDLGSAERVEVGRSNSSSLFGNATGGFVNVRSDLRFERPYAELRERAGSFGYHREQGVIGFAAGSGRGTVSLLNSMFDGWRVHSMSSVTQFQSRFATPLDDQTRLGVMLDAVSDMNRFPGPLTQAQLDADPRQANPNFVTRDDRRHNRLARLALKFDRALAASQDLSASLYMEPKVLQRSERNRFRDFTRYHVGASGVYQVRKRPAAAVESRSAFGFDEAYQDGAILFYNLSPAGGRGEQLIANKQEGANSAGAFVEQELRWKQWALRGALRYDNLYYVSNDFIEPELNANKTFAQWTPKGSLSYALDNHTVFAALGGGVEAPAFNEIDPPPSIPPTSLNPFLEPMRSTTYEVGAKGRAGQLAGLGELRYDVALYTIEVRNDIVPFNGGAYFFTAGHSRRRGAEMGLDWIPTAPLLIQGAVTISDNTYLDYRNDLGDFSGHDVAGLPGTIVSGKATYETAFGFSAQVKVDAIGDYYADDANTARAPAFSVIGGSIAYG